MVIRKSKRPIYYSLFGIDDAIMGGVLGIAGDLFGASMAADAQSSAMQANREMQERNIQWEKEQLTHKHQWEVEDLRAAGLNPILSAPNASSAVSAGVPSNTPVKPEFQLSRSLEALSHSALMKKQTDLQEYGLETDRINAMANMKKARVDEATAPSVRGLNDMQSGWYSMQTELARTEWPFKQAMYEANINKTQQDVLNSIRLVTAQVDYFEKSGDAALINAAAAQESAHAQSRIAAAHELNAQVNAQNGEVRRQVDLALEGKATAETKEAYQRLEANKWQVEKDKAHNPAASNYKGSPANSLFFGIGEVLRNGIGGSVNWSIK